jgi:hypothetical protein
MTCEKCGREVGIDHTYSPKGRTFCWKYVKKGMTLYHNLCKKCCNKYHMTMVIINLPS